MAPVYHALKARPETFEPLCCVTGQHRELLDLVLQTFEITPDIDLDVMREGQALPDIHSSVLLGMREVFNNVWPELVMVHGDTTTSMTSALAAFYAGIPIAHVEAGLRTQDISAPFPEELNRRVTALVARYHFAPTDTSKANLLREGHDPASILVTGNTIIDAMDFILTRIRTHPSLRAEVEAKVDSELRFDWRRKPYVVVTCHRREDLVSKLQELCAALEILSPALPDVHFVFPVHPNPAIRRHAGAVLAGRDNVHLTQPMAYEVFLWTLRSCQFVLTDSGGLQEEAPHLGKPVLLLRDVTERPEAIATGGVHLIGAVRDRIVEEVMKLLADRTPNASPRSANSPYGDGSSARRIVDFLEASEVLVGPRAKAA